MTDSVIMRAAQRISDIYESINICKSIVVCGHGVDLEGLLRTLKDRDFPAEVNDEDGLLKFTSNLSRCLLVNHTSLSAPSLPLPSLLENVDCYIYVTDDWDDWDPKDSCNALELLYRAHLQCMNCRHDREDSQNLVGDTCHFETIA